MYDYLIVGSGLTGAVFAHEAAACGKKCLVLEKRGHIGGNVYTEKMAGIDVHMYGAHIFHTSDKEIWEYMNRFAAFNGFVNSPVADFHGDRYTLPFCMHTFREMWGAQTPEEAKEIIEKQRAEIKGEPKNLEDKAISLVGREIYEKLVKGYTKKQWGRPCSELPPFIIGRLPVRFTFEKNYFSDTYQGVPEGGYTPIIEKMLSGCDVLLNEDFLAGREKWTSMAKKIVYTGPLDAYFGHKLGLLEYRSLRFEHEILDEKDHQGVAVMNFTAADVPYTRRIEHKHFAFGQQEKTVVSREYPLEWQPGLEPYYPINNAENEARCAQYRALAAGEKNVLFAGRLGTYSYMDMHIAVASALRLAQSEGLR